MWHVDRSTWIFALAGLFLVGAFVAHRRRLRNIAHFGDPAVLGLPRLRYCRAAGPVLTAAGAAAIAAALTSIGPAYQGNSGDTVEFVLAADLFEPEPVERATLLVDVGEAARAVIEHAPAHLVAVSISCESTARVIPSTPDAEGVVLLLGSLSATGLESGRTAKTELSPRPGAHVVCVSTRTPEESGGTGSDGRCDGFVTPATATTPPLFGFRDPQGGVRWNSNPSALAGMLASSRPPVSGLKAWLRSTDRAQRLALLAFVLLGVQLLWSLYFR